MTNPKLHMLVNIPNEEYHAGEGVSSTQLVDFVDNPRKYYERHVEKSLSKENTAALRWGSVMDAIILEPDLATELVAVIPAEVLNKDGHRMGKKWTEWRDAQGGKTLLTGLEWGSLMAQVQAVWDCPPAVNWLATSQHQKSLYWMDSDQLPGSDHKLLCKCRYDGIVGGRGFFDLKTTCEPLEKYRYSVTKFKYLLRLGWYALGYAFSYDQWPQDIAWIVVSKEPPYECMVMQPPPNFEAWFMKRITPILADLHWRTKENHWSNDQYQQPVQMDLDLSTYQGY